MKTYCPFCKPEKEKIIIENDSAYAIYDEFPVNKGHMLIIPFRHEADYFNLSENEISSINSLLKAGQKILDDKFFPDGYNIGVNIGKHSGQTIFHVHVHLIPRYKGDVEDPRGGVRGVIPARQKYSK